MTDDTAVQPPCGHKDVTATTIVALRRALDELQSLAPGTGGTGAGTCVEEARETLARVLREVRGVDAAADDSQSQRLRHCIESVAAILQRAFDAAVDQRPQSETPIRSQQELEARLVANIKRLREKIHRLQVQSTETATKKVKSLESLLLRSIDALKRIQALRTSGKDGPFHSFVPFGAAPRTMFAGKDFHTIQQRRAAEAARRQQVEREVSTMSLTTADTVPTLPRQSVTSASAVNAAIQRARERKRKQERYRELQRAISDKLRQATEARERRERREAELNARHKKRKQWIEQHQPCTETERPSKTSDGSGELSTANFALVEPRVAGPRYTIPAKPRGSKPAASAVPVSASDAKHEVVETRRIVGGKIAPPSEKPKARLQPEPVIEAMEQGITVEKRHVRGTTAMHAPSQPSTQALRSQAAQTEREALRQSEWQSKEKHLAAMQQSLHEQSNESHEDDDSKAGRKRTGDSESSGPITMLDPKLDFSSEKLRTPSYSFAKPTTESRKATNGVNEPLPTVDESGPSSPTARGGVSMARMTGRVSVNDADERDYISSDAVGCAHVPGLSMASQQGRGLTDASELIDDYDDIEGDALDLSLTDSHRSRAPAYSFGQSSDRPPQSSNTSSVYQLDQSAAECVRPTKVAFSFDRARDVDYASDLDGDERDFIDDISRATQAVQPQVRAHSFGRARLARSERRDSEDDDDRDIEELRPVKPVKRSAKSMTRSKRFSDGDSDDWDDDRDRGPGAESITWALQDAHTASAVFVPPLHRARPKADSQLVIAAGESGEPKRFRGADWSRMTGRVFNDGDVSDDGGDEYDWATETSQQQPRGAVIQPPPPVSMASSEWSDDERAPTGDQPTRTSTRPFSFTRSDRFAYDDDFEDPRQLLDPTNHFRQSSSAVIGHAGISGSDDQLSVADTLLNPALSGVKPDTRAHLFPKARRFDADDSVIDELAINVSASTSAIKPSIRSSVKYYDVEIDEVRGNTSIQQRGDTLLSENLPPHSQFLSFSRASRFGRHGNEADDGDQSTLMTSHAKPPGGHRFSMAGRYDDKLAHDLRTSLTLNDDRTTQGTSWDQERRIPEDESSSIELALSVDYDSTTAAASSAVFGRADQLQEDQRDLRGALNPSFSRIDSDYKLLSFTREARFREQSVEDAKLALSPDDRTTGVRHAHQGVSIGHEERFTELDRDLRASPLISPQFSSIDAETGRTLGGAERWWVDFDIGSCPALALDPTLPPSTVNIAIDRAERFTEPGCDIRHALFAAPRIAVGSIASLYRARQGNMLSATSSQ